MPDPSSAASTLRRLRLRAASVTRCALSSLGTSRPDAIRERILAMESAPSLVQAHGTDAILDSWTCWFSDSIVPSEGPGAPISEACALR